MSNCSMCGAPVPSSQKVCSMCYGDPAYGTDQYYEEYVKEMERQSQIEPEQMPWPEDEM